MREKEIEQRFAQKIRLMGGVALKFVSPGFDGMPDRMVLLPGGRISFVEVKAKGEKPRPLQVSRMKMLHELGFDTYILDGVEKIENLVMTIASKEGGDA